MEPEVARIRDEIEQVKGAMAEIAARREAGRRDRNNASMRSARPG